MLDYLPSLILERLMREYGVESVTSVLPVRPRTQSNIFKLKVNQSGQAKVWILKEQLGDRLFPKLAFEEEFARCLELAGFDLVAHMVPSASGQLTFAAEGKNFAVYDYIVSDSAFDWMIPQWSDAQCYEAGKCLSDFQAASQEVVTTMSLNLEAEHLYSVLDLDWLQALCGNAIARLSEFNTDKMLVHGDFHPGNLLYSGDEVLCLLDFDHVHMEHPMFDLAYAAAMFSTPAADFKGSDEFFDYRKFRAFISGYSYMAPQELSLSESAQIFNDYLIVVCHLILRWLDETHAQTTEDQYRLASARDRFRSLLASLPLKSLDGL